MRHNIFNSKVPPQHTQKNGIFYGIHVIFCDHTITRFQQIHEKLLYSSQNVSTFQTKRKYILPETQVRLDTNVKAFTSKRTCVFPITSNRIIINLIVRILQTSLHFSYGVPSTVAR